MVITMSSEDTYLTTDEVAAKMRVSRNTVINLIARKMLPATKFGSQYRVSLADLNQYVQDHSNINKEPEDT